MSVSHHLCLTRASAWSALIAIALIALLPSSAAARWRWYGLDCLPRAPEVHRIAVVPLAGSRQPALLGLIAQLRRDLQRSGRFWPVTPKVSRAALRLEGDRLRPRNWQKAGLRWVLKVALRSVRSQPIELLLYSPRRRTGKPLARFRWQRGFKSKKRSWRATSHVITDALLAKLVSRRGLWSTRIAYVRGRRKDSRVFVMNVDSKHPLQVSHEGHEGVLPSWSRQGELAFTSYLWRNPDLYVVRGARAYRLSKQHGLNTGAAFSPDGRRIALTLTKDGNAELYLIDRQGQLLSRLTRHRRIDTSPSFAPDGRQLVFVSNRAGGPQLFVMTVEREPYGMPRQLTSVGSYNQEPAWCPTRGCKWIAFTHRTDEGPYRVMLVHADSGRLRSFGPIGGRSPSWSPDGRYLVYTTGTGLFIRDIEQRCRAKRIAKGRYYTPRWSYWLRGAF